MPTGSTLQYALWVLPQIIAVVLIGGMLRMRLTREHALFFGYLCLQLVRFAVLYPLYRDLRHHAVAYFFTYWAFQAFDVVVTIAIIHEVYRRVFAPYPALCRAGCALFNWAMAMLIVVSFTAAAVAQGPDGDRLVVGVLSFEYSADLLRGGLILLLVSLGIFFRLQWPHYTFGTMLGFAIYLLVAVAAVTMRRHVGRDAAGLYWTVTAVGFNLGSMIWARYFLFSKAGERKLIPYARADLERWDADLAEMMR